MVLPVSIEKDDIEVIQDSITCIESLSDSLAEMFITMLATNTSIEECSIYARAELMNLTSQEEH